MGKKALIILTGILGLAVIMFSVYAQEDMVEIDNTVFTNPQRPPSIFKHDEHNEKAKIDQCNECHHVYENGKRLEYESSEGQPCSDCHGLKGSPEGTLPLMKAFHTNCKGCHLDKQAGPIMCGECHVRESRQ
jgi:hypothetical protein